MWPKYTLSLIFKFRHMFSEVVCDTPLDIANASLNISSHKYLGFAKYTCEENHVMVAMQGEDEISPQIHCQIWGNWTLPSFQCQGELGKYSKTLLSLSLLSHQFW